MKCRRWGTIILYTVYDYILRECIEHFVWEQWKWELRSGRDCFNCLICLHTREAASTVTLLSTIDERYIRSSRPPPTAAGRADVFLMKLTAACFEAVDKINSTMMARPVSSRRRCSSLAGNLSIACWMMRLPETARENSLWTGVSRQVRDDELQRTVFNKFD